jgi:hypothetical protein
LDGKAKQNQEKKQLQLKLNGKKRAKLAESQRNPYEMGKKERKKKEGN